MIHQLIERFRRRPEHSGTLDRDYHEGRRQKRSLIYRLRRRTAEVRRATRRHLAGPPAVILDVGTADGMMLERLRGHYPAARILGLDLSWELLQACPDPTQALLRADASSLPVTAQGVDLLVATAVIEHVPDPAAVLGEMLRVLRPGGLAVLSTPHPAWEQIATLVGHLPDEQHHKTFGLAELAGLCEQVGFEVLEQRRFMLSPVGLPRELEVEALVRRARLGFLFANQLVAARRPR